MPDHYVKIAQSLWHPGVADEKTMMGHVKMDNEKLKLVTAYRCPQCGTLKLVAN